MELVKGIVKVELEDIGEGWSGDYNPEDSEDTPLLRFTVSRLEDGNWEQVADASYCTRIPVDTPEDVQRKILSHIMAHVESNAASGASVKRICEELSWVDASGWA